MQTHPTFGHPAMLPPRMHLRLHQVLTSATQHTDLFNGHEGYYATSPQTSTLGEIKVAMLLCMKEAQGCFQKDYQLLLAKKPQRN